MDRLSKNQLAILTGLSKGFNLKEISKVLKNSPSTIAVQIGNIKIKIFKTKKATTNSLILWFLQQIEVLDTDFNFKDKYLAKRISTKKE